MCCRCQRLFDESVLYQCLPKLQGLHCRRYLKVSKIITPTEAVLIKKSCDNPECGMNVAQQLITQSKILHIVDVMDREDIVAHQAQALPESSWMKRAYIRSRESGDRLSHVPAVADCRDPQVAVGIQPPGAGTTANAFLHHAINMRRTIRNRLPDLSHPNFLKSRDSWDRFLRVATREAESRYHAAKASELHLLLHNGKRAAVTEVEYATLCTQADPQPQITLADINELLCQFYRRKEAQKLEGGPDPPSSSSAVGGATMPTPSDSLNVPTPSTHSQAGYAMGDPPRSSSAPTGTGQFSEGTTPGSTGLPSAPLFNLSGQELSPGSSSLLPPVSEQSQMSGFPADQAVAHQPASTAPAVPNQDSVAYDSPSNYLPIPSPSGQMQSTESLSQDSVTASSQFYPDASVPPVRDSGLQAQPVPDMYGTPHQTFPNVPPAGESGLQAQPVADMSGPGRQPGVPAQFHYGDHIPQPGASAFPTQSPHNPDNLPSNDFGSFPNHSSDSFQGGPF